MTGCKSKRYKWKGFKDDTPRWNRNCQSGVQNVGANNSGLGVAVITNSRALTTWQAVSSSPTAPAAAYSIW